MDEYTPTTEEIREGYVGLPADAYSDPLVSAEFDRWLADHDAAIWEQGKFAMIAYQQGARSKIPYPKNPYRGE